MAKDALGNDVIAQEWLKKHGPGDRTLTEGLKVLVFLCSIIFEENVQTDLQGLYWGEQYDIQSKWLF